MNVGLLVLSFDIDVMNDLFSTYTFDQIYAVIANNKLYF